MTNKAPTLPFADDTTAHAWIASLRRSARQDRHGALNELRAIFLDAPAPTHMAGHMDIGLVMIPGSGALDTIARAASGLWMPWLHKTFDVNSATGRNGFSVSFRPLARIVFRGDAFVTADDRVWGLEYKTGTGESVVDDGKEVFVIDYRGRTRTALMRNGVDELVQLSPTVYLGIGYAVLESKTIPQVWFTLTESA